jgi:hypothetical protein
MKKLRSQHIDEFDFAQYAEAQDLEALAERDGLTNYNTWMLPQILAHYGSWRLVKNDQGQVLPQETAKQNITTPWHMGLWRVVTRLKRGSLVKLQGSPIGVNYSSLVPIVLAGAKRYQNVPYSDWQLAPDSKLVHQELLEAMFSVCPDLGSARLLEIREQGLTIKSGAKAGSVQKATSKWTLTGIQDTELFGLPKLAVTMLTQIWVANPSLRTELMILDPKNWDVMPKPLVDSEIFHPQQVQQPLAERVVDLPWN